MSTWALDLDGVLWTGAAPIAGSAEAVARLRSRGHEVTFVTNNSFATVAQQEQKLASFGIEATGSVVTSAMAAASLVEPGERVFVLGGPGVREAVTARGGVLLEVPAPASASDLGADLVLVGLDWDLSYDRLRAAVSAIIGGARFVATNTDATYPTEFGLFPGAGAFVAAVATATEVTPTVAGKPAAPIAAVVKDRFGDDGIMVGDRPDTDGEFAVALGYQFGLVLSGVTTETDLPVEPSPDVIANDLSELVDLIDR